MCMASIVSNIYIASNKVVGIILQFNNIIEGQKVLTLHFDASRSGHQGGIKKNDPARIRTWNLLIRSQTPYPLGHRARSSKRVTNDFV